MKGGTILVSKNLKKAAFTVAEIALVATIIGILAAIILLGYRGVVNNANDRSVQADLQKIDDAMKQFNLDNNGIYPQNTTQLATLRLKVAPGSYTLTNRANLYFCANSAFTEYAVVAMSRSGNRFVVKSESGISNYTGGAVWDSGSGNWATTCSSVNAAYAPLTGNLTGLVNTTWSSWISTQ